MNDPIDTKNVRDSRYCQLLELAEDGNEEAICDLWHEFAADFRL